MSEPVTFLRPDTIAEPFGAYSHGVVIPSGARIVRTSGQLGLAADGNVPTDVRAQAEICFGNIEAILADAGMAREHVVHFSAYVTKREHMADYMAARDAWLAGRTPPPASTLMIASGFTRPEFLVEVEAMAVSTE